MFIHELARQTGVSTTTIRYYESIGLLPAPSRAANNYRQYTALDAERLRFVAGARGLGFSVAELVDILATRDAGVAPCERVLATLDHRLGDLERHLADLLTLRDTLIQLRRDGAALPQTDVRSDECICTLLQQLRANVPVTLPREEDVHV
jgi:DNA-binding transcriptional MerR regulator